jgi:hypothetical protein
MDNLHPLFADILKSHIDAITTAQTPAKTISDWTQIDNATPQGPVIKNVTFYPHELKAVQRALNAHERETREHLQMLRAKKADAMSLQDITHYAQMINRYEIDLQMILDAQSAMQYAKSKSAHTSA